MSYAESSALIGYTGFVGSNLLQTRSFDYLYNSRNIGEIRGQHLGTVVCAGVSAVKWLANKEPETDLAAIEALKADLKQASISHLILISTIDVYPSPFGVTEADVPLGQDHHPYGRHRRMLEEWATIRFPRCTIVRLPALFGRGLKKNIIFDMLTRNMVDQINPNGSFQWYSLARLNDDLQKIVASGVSLVNIAVEPVLTEEIRVRFFPELTLGPRNSPILRYDMQTCHAGLLGGAGAYHVSKEEGLRAMGEYIETARTLGP